MQFTYKDFWTKTGYWFDVAIYSAITVPLVFTSFVKITRCDFIEMFNRYPEDFKKVSVIQHETARIAFNERTGGIDLVGRRDIFGN